MEFKRKIHSKFIFGQLEQLFLWEINNAWRGFCKTCLTRTCSGTWSLSLHPTYWYVESHELSQNTWFVFLCFHEILVMRDSFVKTIARRFDRSTATRPIGYNSLVSVNDDRLIPVQWYTVFFLKFVRHVPVVKHYQFYIKEPVPDG